jgi:TATA-box binding protein (TBP) (component of TFIID and TFIIIB)
MDLNTTTDSNIDDEWSNFIAHQYDGDSSEEENNKSHDNNNNNNNNSSDDLDFEDTFKGSAPTPTNIYISTKSKIAYLEQPIDLKIFWDIPIITYTTPKNGVIKKQLKINSKTPEDLISIQNRLKKELYYDEHIICHIDNPNGRIKFKDIRKITIGISKKDIMSYRSKKKQAFYNCFVMILRIKFEDTFKEFHIKVFNTGKLEIPGVQSEAMFEKVLKHIIEILQPYHEYPISYKQTSDTVLINSNFNCGFYINREVLYDTLRNKYNIQAIYDPCSYPGIQCKFYYNNDIGVQTGMQISKENKDKYNNITEVSFMIFRTGSVLIVGMCDENILEVIYHFLTSLLKTEFKFICQKLITKDDINLKDKKKKKIRKRFINIITGVEDPVEINMSHTTTLETPPITEEIVPKLKADNIKQTKKMQKINKDKKNTKDIVFDVEEELEVY